MHFIEFFNFRGRCSRTTWWLGNAVSIVAVYAVVFVAATFEQSAGTNGWTSPSGLLALFALIGILWFDLSIHVKRWHDRDKSGWWQLIGLVPVIGLWAIIDPGFFPRKEGPNRFGP